MRDFQEKRTFRHILQSRPVLILLGIILLFFAWNVFGFWGRMQETSRNRKIVEDKVLSLGQQKEQLSQDIAKLKTDEGIEENIREKFGLVKEGEGLIVVVEEKPSLEANTGDKSGGFFNFLKNLFK